MEEGVGRGAELLDAEVVVVDEALEEISVGGLGAHFDAAAYAVEGHGDNSITGLPTYGAVFCVVDNRPNPRLGLDEGLVSVSVILWREVVDGGVLVEVVGCVGFALGGGTVSNIVVGIGNFVCRDQFIADVVTILLIILGSSASEEVVGVDVSGIDGVGDGGEEVTVGFVSPRDHIFVGISEGRFEVRSRKIRPLEAVGFEDSPRGGIIDNGLFPFIVHAVAHVPAEGVPMSGKGLGIEARKLLREELAEGIVDKGRAADDIDGISLTLGCVVSINQAFSHATPHRSSYSSTILLSIRSNPLTFIVVSIMASLSNSNTS